MSITRTVGILLLLVMTGCASLQRAPSQPGATPSGDSVEPAVTPPLSEGAAKLPEKTTGSGAVEQTPKKKSAAPGPGTQPAPLDITALEKRLRETEAIGAFTKLALKNQVDDLVEQFRELHQRRGKPTQLRQSYDLLFLKVLSLLQDSDPALAKAIVASRESIWGILADPVKFSSI